MTITRGNPQKIINL